MESFSYAAKAYMEDRVFCAFDIETTGLDPHLDRIVEFGAVKFDRRGVIARYAALINPGIPMPVEASRVNNITDDMLADKPPIAEVLPDFISFVKNTVIIAHNAPFDSGFVNEALKNLWEKAEENSARPPFPSLPNPVADTLVCAKEAFPALKSYSLQNLAAELRIPALDAHRACDDARLCMEIFVLCMEAAENPLKTRGA